MSLFNIFVDIAARTANFESGILRVERGINKMAASVKRAAAGAVAGFAIEAVVSTVIKSTVEAEQSLAKLNNALRNNAGAAGVNADELAAMSAELQKTSTFGDQAIQSMQGILLRFREIGGPNFANAQTAIADMASALGQDLTSASETVARALAQPERGIKLLRAAGISFTQEQSKQIEVLTKTGERARAQAIILEQLRRTFDGAAAAARNTLGGALEALKSSFGSLGEVSGTQVSSLTKAINDLAATLSDPNVKKGIQDLAGVILAAGILIVRGAALIGRGFGAIIEHVRGGSTAIDQSIARIKTYQAQLQSLEHGFNEFEKSQRRRELAAEQSRLDRLIGRGGPTRRFTPGTPRPDIPKASVEIDTKEFDQAHKAIQDLIRDMEQQTATIDATAVATMRYRIEQGDLADEFAKLGTAGKALKEQLLEAAAAQEQATATKALDQMISAVEQQIATMRGGALAALDYQMTQGELAKQLEATGEQADKYRQALFAVTLETEALKAATDGMNEPLEASLAAFSADFEKRFLEPLDKMSTFAEQAARNIQTHFADFLFDPFEKGIRGMAEGFVNTIRRMAAEALAANIMEALGIEQLLKTGSSSGGNWMQTAFSWFGALFGGASAKAEGGPVQPGRPYLVGERGPELAMFARSGFIMPNRDLQRLARAGEPRQEPMRRVVERVTTRIAPRVNVNFNISTPDADSFRRAQSQIAARMGLAVTRATQRNL